MIPLTLFLLACGAIYLGTIQAAFNALMRVSLRLLAEGSGRAPDLERYLQEPLLLFLPLRTLLGLIEGFTVLLLAHDDRRLEARRSSSCWPARWSPSVRSASFSCRS